jgi:hypothetical protein
LVCFFCVQRGLEGRVLNDSPGDCQIAPQLRPQAGKSFHLHHEKRQVSTETCRFQLYSPYGELYAPSVRDICFASDMPAGVRGEYNITETVGFNITFCVAKYITPSKTEYH